MNYLLPVDTLASLPWKNTIPLQFAVAPTGLSDPTPYTRYSSPLLLYTHRSPILTPPPSFAVVAIHKSLMPLLCGNYTPHTCKQLEGFRATCTLAPRCIA